MRWMGGMSLRSEGRGCNGAFDGFGKWEKGMRVLTNSTANG